MTTYDSHQASSEIGELQRTVAELRLRVGTQEETNKMLRHALHALVTGAENDQPFDHEIAHLALAQARETEKTFITER